MSGRRRTYCRHCKKGSRVPDYCPHCGADKKSAQPWKPSHKEKKDGGTIHM